MNGSLRSPALGIRVQIVLLAVVPLIFLVLTLFYATVLARSSEASTLISQRAGRILEQSDLMTQAVGKMTRSLQQFQRSQKDADLKDFDAAATVIPEHVGALSEAVRGTPLEAAGARYAKAITEVVALFSSAKVALQAKRPAELVRLMSLKSTKALGVETEAAKVELSQKTANAVLVISVAGRRSITNTERLLLIFAAAGVVITIVLAFVIGLRMVRRLGILADNGRRASAGEPPIPLNGTDEFTQLDVIYRALFDEGMRSRAQLAGAKQRLEHAVDDYSDLAARIAAGDLSARAAITDEHDELGRLGSSLNLMASSLEQLVEQISAAAASLASATNQILAATSQQVSSATEEATAVRQTAATVLEVRQTAEMAARKTKLVSDLAQRVEQTAESGKQSVEASVQSSEQAKAQMVTLAERILAFHEQAQTIAEINATVAEIAGQSNLLAVNAAIEAAKAGEASRGFAVVAGEVKELGARSKEATVQVRRIVGEIQRSAQSAVMAAEQGVKAAETGSSTAERSGEAMEILILTIAEASAAALQISASAEQQQAGMDQIALAMQNIEHAAMQSVAATQQVERAAADLDQLARKLAETIRAATGTSTSAAPARG
jgi:methyl-accepting chemotaxis protein